ncbi:MAG: hypothetical protein EBR82_64525, partial [Caulobacteraceae bacterium]|nr:hypothetical protein [Caulobacteraceae bacterium]
MVQETARINFEAGNLDLVEGRIKAIGGAINVLGGAVETTVGLMGLIGVDEKVSKKFQEAATSAIAFADGTKRVFEGYKELREAADLFRKAQAAGTAVTAANTVATTANNTAQASSVGLLGKARAAWNAFTAALIRNPITAIIVGITALAAALFLYSQRADEATESADNFNDTLNGLNAALDRELALIDREIALAKQRGANEKEIFDLEVKKLNIKQKVLNLSEQELLKERQRLLEIKNAGDATEEQLKEYEEIGKALDAIGTNRVKTETELIELQTEYNKALKEGVKAPTPGKSVKEVLDEELKLREEYQKEYDNIIQKRVFSALKGAEAEAKFLEFADEARENSINKMLKIADKFKILTPAGQEAIKSQTDDILAAFSIIQVGAGTLKTQAFESLKKQIIETLGITDKEFTKFAESNKELFQDAGAGVTSVFTETKNGIEKLARTSITITKEQANEFLEIYQKLREDAKKLLEERIDDEYNTLTQSRESELAELKIQLDREMDLLGDNFSARIKLFKIYRNNVDEVNKRYDELELQRQKDANQKELDYHKRKNDYLDELLGRTEENRKNEKIKMLEDGLFKFKILGLQETEDYKTLQKELNKILKEGLEERSNKLKEFFESDAAKTIGASLQALNQVTSGILSIAQESSERRLNNIEAEYSARINAIQGTDEQAAAQREALEQQMNAKMEAE